MKYIFGLMFAPMILSAQMREDLFEDIDMKTILTPVTFEEIPVEPETMIYYYALVKKNESQRMMKGTKSTSEYTYQKGRLDAYNDVLQYIFMD